MTWAGKSKPKQVVISNSNMFCFLHYFPSIYSVVLHERGVFPTELEQQLGIQIMMIKYEHALIVGAGPGLSASLARIFSDHGLGVCLGKYSLDLGDSAYSAHSLSYRAGIVLAGYIFDVG